MCPPIVNSKRGGGIMKALSFSWLTEHRVRHNLSEPCTSMFNVWFCLSHT